MFFIVLFSGGAGRLARPFLFSKISKISNWKFWKFWKPADRYLAFVDKNGALVEETCGDGLCGCIFGA